MNAEMSENIRAGLLRLGVQISELLTQRRLGVQIPELLTQRKQIPELLTQRKFVQPELLTQRKFVSAASYSNAHKPPKTVAPTTPTNCGSYSFDADAQKPPKTVVLMRE